MQQLDRQRKRHIEEILITKNLSKSFYEKKNIIITGSSGVLGKYLVNQFKKGIILSRFQEIKSLEMEL